MTSLELYRALDQLYRQADFAHVKAKSLNDLETCMNSIYDVLSEADKDTLAAEANREAGVDIEERDSSAPCEMFSVGLCMGDCQGDGHYRCCECRERASITEETAA
jgi:hypothetical protein